jgi:MoaA/NifB/PqqE/SkfB family radical SAM enzyme
MKNPLIYFKRCIDFRNSNRTPAWITLFVTKRCNAKCKHCFYWRELNKKEYEMTLDDYKKLANSFRNKVETIILTGGEPFLRDDIAEICNIFKDKTKNITIATNASLTEKTHSTIKEIMKNLNDKTKLKIYISLDGDKELHEKIRGVPIFDQTIRTMNKLKDIKNLELTTQTVISNSNYKHLERINDFVSKLKIPHSFSMVRMDNLIRSRVHANKYTPRELETGGAPPINELDNIYNRIKKIIKSNGESLNSLKVRGYLDSLRYSINYLRGNENKKRVPCLAGRAMTVIYSNGDVSVCEMINHFANLKEFNFNFHKLWNSKKAEAIRKSIKNCYCTHGCFIGPSEVYYPPFFLKNTFKNLISHEKN